jgi:hypothetical protein
MQIIITWSNGMTSHVEVPAPADATPLRTSVGMNRPDTPLHQRADGLWECHSVKPGGALVGYCLGHEMARLVESGHPIEGLSWTSVWNDPKNHTLASVIARCPWITQAAWERDRSLRIANKSKFHFHGHATEKAAIDCYQQFLTDFGQCELETV